MTELEKDYGCRIGNYIKNEYSICREERQYALFLYNILRFFREPDRRNDTAQAIFDACQIPTDATVTDVFYEVTFMRDFFERNRRWVLGGHDANRRLNKSFSPSDYKIKNAKEDSFNYKLMEYVLGCVDFIDSTVYSEEEKNWGRNKIQTKLSDSAEEDSERKSIIRHMMNVKPDIAVLYNQKEVNYLLFLECKFESGEFSYPLGEKNNQGLQTNVKEPLKPRISQRKIQWMIADFLCGSYFKGDLKVSGSMEKEKSSCLVQFVRRKEQRVPAQGNIWLCDLIDLNAEIFH